MKNKKFTFLTLINIFFISILFGMLNLFFYKAPLSTIWIDNSFKIKDRYAKSINKNKIVVSSGSNTLYGMETHLIEKELNIPTVNMAIHAGLKTEYIIYRTKKNLKPGDTIILPLEYQNFTWNGEISETYKNYILTHDREYIKRMRIKDKLSLIYSVSPISLSKSIIEQQRELSEPEIGVGYNSNTLNINGDETYKLGHKGSINTAPFSLPSPYNIETYGLLKIKEFSKWCVDNNISFFITFPNTVDIKEYHAEPYTSYFDFLISYFNENNIQTIGFPTDSLYPIDYFYDTNYHMNSKGAEVRTMQFIANLKKRIIRNCYPNQISRP